MVLDILNQNIHRITTCTWNRPWIEPTIRQKCYQNLSTINPIDVILTSRSADRIPEQQNCANHNNLIKIETCNKDLSNSKKLKFGFANARSVCNKLDSISEIVNSESLDIFAICETWITNENSYVLDQIRTPDQVAIHVPRTDRRGGGVAIICKSLFKPVQQDSDSFQSFEHVVVKTHSKEARFTIVNIYRPPHSNLTQFFAEFTSLLDNVSYRKEPLLLCGDFNIRMQDRTDTNKRKLDDLLTQYDLIQHVKGPTHISGNTIDLIMTRASDNLTNFADVSSLISDHFLVSAHINIDQPPKDHSISSFRKKVTGLDI